MKKHLWKQKNIYFSDEDLTWMGNCKSWQKFDWTKFGMTNIFPTICVSTLRKGPVVSKDQNQLFAICWMAVLSSQFCCKNFWNRTLGSWDMAILLRTSLQIGEKLILRRRLLKFRNLYKVLVFWHKITVLCTKSFK